jgi:RsiW-degrading membrane proteinase PrsW (M82 family)
MAEESLKFLPVVLLAFVFKQVRKPIDGMFYGALAGLGFAAWEGYKYVIDPKYGGVLIQTLVRSTALPFLHAAYTAIGCYLVALATREKTTKGRIKLCAFGYLSAATIHGVYDFLSDTPKIMTAIVIYLLFSAYAAQSQQVAEEWEHEVAGKVEPQLPEAQAASAAV